MFKYNKKVFIKHDVNTDYCGLTFGFHCNDVMQLANFSDCFRLAEHRGKENRW